MAVRLNPRSMTKLSRKKCVKNALRQSRKKTMQTLRLLSDATQLEHAFVAFVTQINKHQPTSNPQYSKRQQTQWSTHRPKYISQSVPNSPLVTMEARRKEFFRAPFLDDTLMDPNTPPRLSKEDFGLPRLRKCPWDIEAIDWRRVRLLGTGMDGCVWRVYFGDQGPYALKLFWLVDTTKLWGSYFAAQRECQNATLLQMIRASLDQEAAAEAAAQAVVDAGGERPMLPEDEMDPGTAPITVIAEPKTCGHAIHNLFSFAAEVRRWRARRSQRAESNGGNGDPTLEMLPRIRMRDLPMPRFAQCHGWLRVRAHEMIERIPPRHRPEPICLKRHTEPTYLQKGHVEFYAIVYEYVHSAVQETGEKTTDEKTEVEQAGQTTQPAQSAQVVHPERRELRPNTMRQRQQYQEQKQQAEKQQQADKQQQQQPAQRWQPPPYYRPLFRQQGRETYNDPEKVAAVARFLNLVGFQFGCQPLNRNWKDGVLVDHADLVGPFHYGWYERYYKLWHTDDILVM